MAHSRICSVEGCGKPHFGHGWCQVHLYRWRKHGDPLSGRASPGEVTRYFLEVVLKYDGDECLLWPYAKTTGGYGQINYEGKRHVVSRLVCENVKGPPPSPEHDAAHSCGKGHLRCVTKRHLSWKTKVQNQSDRIVHGTHSRGERHQMSRLAENDVRQIRALRGKATQVELAEQFGVSQVAISNIHTGRRWGWLPDPTTS